MTFKEILEILYLVCANPSFYHLSLITLLFFVVWRKSINGGFLIDDDQGIQKFSDRWITEVTPEKQFIREYKVDYEEVENPDKTKTKYPFLGYHHKYLGFPGAFMRWHRLHIGKKFQVLGKNQKGHDVYGYVQDPKRHHVWSLMVQWTNLIVLYFTLSKLFGQNTAFFSTLLFSVYPLGCQNVAWISGINYIYSMLFMTTGLLVSVSMDNLVIGLPVVALCTFLSSITLLSGCFSFLIYLVVGPNWYALTAFLVGIAVLFRDGRTVVNYRKESFKKQNMESSTIPKLCKIWVVFKTLAYYIIYIPFPAKMGLYHEYGYHYDDAMEHPDKKAFLGIFFFILFIITFIFGNFLTRFSILWFFANWIPFSNFITANQFVVERYVFISSLSYCLVLSAILLQYPVIFAFLLGAYTIRTALHLWTFQNHEDFYLSNWLNFRNSEVALGNLGVMYLDKGYHGKAVDTWDQATRINPHYDVPWYNLFSMFKSKGEFGMAKFFLEKCMDSKVLHFGDQWKKDQENLERIIQQSVPLTEHAKRINDSIKECNYES